jgi:hypothetical protein
METELSPASTISEPQRQAEIAQRLTDLARQLQALLTEFPSEAVWNRPARLIQLADDCKAEAEDFDESLEQRAQALAAWDEVVKTLKQGRPKQHH